MNPTLVFDIETIPDIAEWLTGRCHQQEVGWHRRIKKAFQASAAGNFGSGWTWPVMKADRSLGIVNMGADGNPLTTGDKALPCMKALTPRADSINSVHGSLLGSPNHV